MCDVGINREAREDEPFFIKTSKILHELNTNVLPPVLEAATNIHQIHEITYCAAIAVIRATGLRISDGNVKVDYNNPKMNTLPWKRRLTKTIETLRKNIARLTAYTI